MKRYTIKQAQGYEVNPVVSEKEVIEKLGKLEDMIEAIIDEQRVLSEVIKQYHDGFSKKVHWRAKESMGKKGINAMLLMEFKRRGIEIGEDDGENG